MKSGRLKRIAKGFRDEIVGVFGGDGSENYCYMVSMPIEGYLNALGVECRCVEGFVNGSPVHHWWVELSDGRIIDATADQFTVNGQQLPPIIVGTRPDFYKPKEPK
jgi:hypothetical protein